MTVNKVLIREAWNRLENCANAYIQYKQDLAYLGDEPKFAPKPEEYADVNEYIAYLEALESAREKIKQHKANEKELHATYMTVIESTIAWWHSNNLQRQRETEFVTARFGDYVVIVRRNSNGYMEISVRQGK